MTTADALLAAVVANPADDLPRLVYADWCEENGDAERAEFIRLQIGRANGTATADAHIREKVLQHAHAERWLAPLRQPGAPLGTRRSHAVFRRGFVEAVWLPATWFVRTADKLFAACPVDELRVIFDDVSELFSLVECEHLARLRTLDLCDQRFGVDGALCLRFCRHLRRLTSLRLAGCNIDDAAAGILRDLPMTLDELDLRHNPLSTVERGFLRSHFGDAVVFG